jgi:hypothetical protein
MCQQPAVRILANTRAHKCDTIDLEGGVCRRVDGDLPEARGRVIEGPQVDVRPVGKVRPCGSGKCRSLRRAVAKRGSTC